MIETLKLNMVWAWASLLVLIRPRGQVSFYGNFAAKHGVDIKLVKLQSGITPATMSALVGQHIKYLSMDSKFLELYY